MIALFDARQTMPTIPQQDIPATLWADEKLLLPEALPPAYKAELQARSLWDVFVNGVSSAGGAIGGASSTEAEKHFSGRFLNSTARAEYVLLDPREEEPGIPDAFFELMADGTLPWSIYPRVPALP